MCAIQSLTHVPYFDICQLTRDVQYQVNYRFYHAFDSELVPVIVHIRLHEGVDRLFLPTIYYT